MPGTWTNGLPPITPGLPTADSYRGVSGYELLPFDTQRARGAAPQSVAMSVFQAAAQAAYMSVNTATDAGAGTTQNTIAGRTVLGGASTTLVVDGEYTVAIANSIVTATSTIQCICIPGANTVPGMIVRTITPGAGTFSVTVRNSGTATQDGASVLVWQVLANQT